MIKSFYFQHASYVIEDRRGNSLILNMDYRNGNFTLDYLTGKKTDKIQLAKIVKRFAQELLKKKSGTNLAEEITQKYQHILK